MKPCLKLARLLRRKKVTGLFVTGTDTGVGKTFITTQLVLRLQESGLDAVAIKPVACGDCGRKDAVTFWKLAGLRIPLRVINPYWFRKPLAPVAQSSKLRVSPRKISEWLRKLRRRHDTVIVEGAGGLLVPLGWKLSVRDLARSLALPLVIVARAGLGTLNHTILTVEAARHAGLEVLAVVLNDYDGRNAKAAIGNQRVLRRLLKLPVWMEPRSQQRLL